MNPSRRSRACASRSARSPSNPAQNRESMRSLAELEPDDRRASATARPARRGAEAARVRREAAGRASGREQRQVGLALAAQHREVDLDAGDPPRLGQHARLRLDDLRGEDAAAVRQRRIEPDALEVAVSCSTASIVPMRLISTATQPSSSSRHMRSTGPMSVGHSRRTRRKPSPHHSGCVGERSCRSRSTPSFSSAAAVAHVVGDVAEHLGDPDVEPVVALDLAHDDRVRAPPRSRSAASSSSAACSRRCRRGPSPTRRP